MDLYKGESTLYHAEKGCNNMKILVPVKRVIDPYVKVRVKANQSDVETANVKMAVNPFDEIAVEEAMRLKEQGIASEVIVVSIGSDKCQETLRTAMALGADRAILVQLEDRFEPLNIAKILKAVVDKEQPQLVIMGKQSTDADNNQTGQMLAALLNWPQGTFASKVTMQDTSVEVTREIDGGLETLSLKLPAVITTDLRLNEPRYATLPNIMKAKKKPLETFTASDLGVEIKEHAQLVKVETPAERSAGQMVGSVSQLVEKLKDEAKVI